MKITHIRADNFKSLVDFDLPLSHFNCLVGLNGAGKSTVLQFIDFLAQQMRGDIKGWLDHRNWKPSDINSKLTKKRNIEFEVSLEDDHGSSVTWSGSFNTTKGRCTTESLVTSSSVLTVEGQDFEIKNLKPDTKGKRRVLGSRGRGIPFTYQGSILSVLKETALHESILQVKHFFAGIHSLDLLSPELLRQRTRESDGTLGIGGRQLSAFIHELPAYRRLKLTKKLRNAYRNLRVIRTKPLRSGWKQLTATELYGDLVLHTEARHLNDGMLRLLAILAELQTEHPFVLFDEIENGINPELVEFVIDTLVESPQQVVVTTHSPLILNFLEDDVAREGVIYLYRTKHGATQAIRLFDIPSLAKKLSVLGPGEAFVDTDLTTLSREIARVGGHH
jgi:predicted ATPase